MFAKFHAKQTCQRADEGQWLSYLAEKTEQLHDNTDQNCMTCRGHGRRSGKKPKQTQIAFNISWRPATRSHSNSVIRWVDRFETISRYCRCMPVPVPFGFAIPPMFHQISGQSLSSRGKKEELSQAGQSDWMTNDWGTTVQTSNMFWGIRISIPVHECTWYNVQITMWISICIWFGYNVHDVNLQYINQFYIILNRLLRSWTIYVLFRFGGPNGNAADPQHTVTSHTLQ